VHTKKSKIQRFDWSTEFSALEDFVGYKTWFFFFSFKLKLIPTTNNKHKKMRPTFAGPSSSTGNYKSTTDPGKQFNSKSSNVLLLSNSRNIAKLTHIK